MDPKAVQSLGALLLLMPTFLRQITDERRSSHRPANAAPNSVPTVAGFGRGTALHALRPGHRRSVLPVDAAGPFIAHAIAWACGRGGRVVRSCEFRP